jgi:CDP-diacylglycerol--glycerol-3-phosphate 3-phosphatidyltransferase
MPDGATLRYPPSMTLPNKLTLGRLGLALIGFFCLWMQRDDLLIAAFALYLFATCTDWVDGYIARKTGAISPFGKIADPIADKVLVIGALVAFMRNPEIDIPAWALFLIVVRELLMGGVRGLAAIQGRVLAADSWGKWSMVIQSVAVLLILLYMIVDHHGWPSMPDWTDALPYQLVVLCAIASVLSGTIYLWKTRSLLRKSWSVQKK